MSLKFLRSALRINLTDEDHPPIDEAAPHQDAWKTIRLRREAWDVLVLLAARDVLLTGHKQSMATMIEALLKIATPVILGRASIVKAANEMEVANVQVH